MLKNKKLLKEFSTEQIKVYSVDGDFIRKNDDCDFYRGGNWLMYSYIPTKEIWVDNRLNPIGIKLSVLGNYALIPPMSQGISYEDSAKHYADEAELKANRKNIDVLIREAISKANESEIDESSHYNNQIHHTIHTENSMYRTHKTKVRQHNTDQIVTSRS